MQEAQGDSDEEAVGQSPKPADGLSRTESKRFSMFVRDTGIISCDSDRAVEILKAEQFMTSLPGVSYQVVKIFSWGGRKNRILKLTSSGIENMRGNITSSFHTYSSILRIILKDLDTFVIQYDGTHDYTYRSPVAMQIVQEITTRTAIARTTEKKKMGYEVALKYQQELAAENRGSLNNEPASPSASSSSSSSSLSSSSSSVAPGVDAGESPRNKYRSFMDPTLQKVSEVPDVRRQAKASKLQTIFGSTEQQRLEEAVERILLEGNTFENKAISTFVKNFTVLEANPATVGPNIRQFISGLKEHIVDSRKEELSKLLVTAATESFQPDELSLNNIIERCLQRVIVVPLRERTLKCMQKLTGDADHIIYLKILSSKLKSQAEIGVLPDDVSPTNWSTAVVELNKGFSSAVIPTEYLGALLATARAIYNSVNYERARQGLSHAFLSADSFLPIFIYVVVQLKEDLINNLETLTEFLWHLSPPEQLNGEGGYYLTVFVSALQYIKAYLLEEVRLENATEMVDLRSYPQPISSSSSSTSLSPASSASAGGSPSSSSSSSPNISPTETPPTSAPVPIPASLSSNLFTRLSPATPSDSPVLSISASSLSNNHSHSSSPASHSPSPATEQRRGSRRLVQSLRKAVLP